MKAAVYTSYGTPDVIQFKNLSTPIPKDREIIVKLKASTVTAGDSRIRAGQFPKGISFLVRMLLGFTKPRVKVLGMEFTGVVSEVGKDVSDFSIGDEVIGFDTKRMGAHAEYKSIREDGLVLKKPETISYEEAVSVSFGGLTVIHFMNITKAEKGQKALVIGASGSVGSAFVQILTHHGVEVTGVAGPNNQELIKKLGAVESVDYSKQDYITKKKYYDKFDLIFDTTSSHSFKQLKHLLKDKGQCCFIAANLSNSIEASMSLLTRSGKRAIVGVAAEYKENLKLLLEMAEKRIFTPLIDKSYSFSELRDAHVYVETGRKRGNVVINF